jgi:hypothetical protein
MKPILVTAGDLSLGDIVSTSHGPFDSCVVTKLAPEGIHLFRPYAITSDFSYSGGVIPYVGHETYVLSRTSPVTLLHKAEPKR